MGKPIVLSSGMGLHAYWPLSASVTRDEWRYVAEKLKQAVVGWKTDPTITADAARVLRLPGCTWRKGLEPRAVQVLDWGDAPRSLAEYEAVLLDDTDDEPATSATPLTRSVNTKPSTSANDWNLGPIPAHILERRQRGAQVDNSVLGKSQDWIGDPDELKSALWASSPVEQSVWSEIAFALYPLGEDGLALYLEWSEQCDPEGWSKGGAAAAIAKFNDKAGTYRESDGTGRVKTIFDKARAAGWKGMDSFGNGHIGAVPPAPSEQTKVRFPEPFKGFMAKVVAGEVAIAHKAQPELTTLATLIGMASACAGRYRLPSGARCNLYGLGIAESGEGKDRPLTLAKEIAFAAGAKCIGAPASGQGLEDALIDGAAMFCGLPEVGHVLQTLSSNVAPAAHTIELEKNLLELFSASGRTYTTREKATARSTKPSHTLKNPCLNLLGFTVPDMLAKALSTERIASGLLGRLLFVVGDRDVPHHLSWGGGESRHDVYKLVGMRFDEDAVGVKPGEVIDIGYSEETQRWASELLKRFQDERAKSGRQEVRSLLARAYERAERIAGVLAVWDNPHKPILTVANLEWAERAVRASDQALLQFCEDRLHDDEIQANAARIVRVVRDTLNGSIKPAGTAGRALLKQGLVPRSLVLQRSKLNVIAFDFAVNHAVGSDLLEAGTVKENLGVL